MDDEDNGDAEQTGDEGEPDFRARRWTRNSRRRRAGPYGPGCPISDPDYGGEEAGEPDGGAL